MNNELSKLTAAMKSSSLYGKNSTQYYKEVLQDELDIMWEYASNVYNIEEEYPYGSGLYRPVTVRLDGVKTPDTGYKNTDDYKRIEFKTQSVEHGISCLYRFYDNYWIATVSDTIGENTDELVVTRCNNFLKWVDNDGIVYSEPCFIDYRVSGNNNAKTNDITSVSGNERIYLQRNERTQTIRSNQRFLIGTPQSWSCFKVAGNGMINFISSKTGQYDSYGLLQLNVIESQINTNTDDLINGIADYYISSLNLTFNVNSINDSIGSSITLIPTLTQNGNVLYDKHIKYYSQDINIATVDELNGTVKLIGVGKTNILCEVINDENKLLLTITIPVEVNSEPVENVIRVTPTISSMLQGKTVIFDYFVYSGDNKLTEPCIFEVVSKNIPDYCYQIKKMSDNSLSLTNKQLYLYEPLVIRISNIDNSLTYDLSIDLRGTF